MKTRGFTLTELLVAVAVLGILTMIAIPNLRALVRSQGVKTASFDVFSSLVLARSEAINRNESVTIKPVGGNWSEGWTITAADGEVVRRQGYVTHITISGPSSITYNNSGRVTTGTTSISLKANDVRSRCIFVDLSGRPVSKQEVCS
jgi:type IV fimbrial biogenesis protein FimT